MDLKLANLLRALLFILFLPSVVSAQDVVLSFKNDELSRRITKDSYSIQNAENNNLAIIILERKDAAAYLFDSKLKELTAFTTENIKSKYKEILGYSIDNDIYSVFYANNTRSKFAFHQLDFKSKTSSVKEIELNLDKKEILLDAINYNNNLFLFTANNNNVLTLRKYNGDAFEVLKTFNLEEIKEHTSLINSKIAIGIFVLAGSETSNVTKIDTRIPNTIERTSNKNKLYQKENIVQLTFDNNEEHTVLYTIDLDKLDLKVKTYPYPKPRLNDAFKKANSFLFEDKIYQIASSKDEMAFEIKDLEGNLLKDFYVNRDMNINFKNSPIIQEGATALPFVTTRKLEQTTKYLRKISSGNPGINVQKIDGKYYVTLGGYQVIYTGGISPVVSTPNMNGVFISYNPTYLSYSGYTTTKSTYFNTILDLNFNHIKGKLDSNNFDRIEAFKKEIKYNTAEDVFYLNDTLYFGYFNLKESLYNLVKF